MPAKNLLQLFLFSGIFILVSCNNHEFISARKTMDLSGTWEFSMDTAQVGIDEKWFAESLNESVRLPGTMDENNKGIPNLNHDETMRLSRERMYEGWAWYQKELTIDDSWSE